MQILTGPVKEFLANSQQVGGDVAEVASMVQACFIAQRRFLEVAPQSQKPGPKVLPLLIEATSHAINATVVSRLCGYAADAPRPGSSLCGLQPSRYLEGGWGLCVVCQLELVS